MKICYSFFFLEWNLSCFCCMLIVHQHYIALSDSPLWCLFNGTVAIGIVAYLEVGRTCFLASLKKYKKDQTTYHGRRRMLHQSLEEKEKSNVKWCELVDFDARLGLEEVGKARTCETTTYQVSLGKHKFVIRVRLRIII